MIQIEVDNIYLDLYDTSPPQLTFSIEDILTTEQTSTYSKTFRVPATPKNNQFFKTAYAVDGYDFDVTQIQLATLFINGLYFEQGELRLNKIYKNGNGGVDYELIFFGQTKSISSLLGESKLCELSSTSGNTTTSIEHTFNYENVIKSWEAFPSGTTTSGLAEGNVLYPLIDFGNIYDEDNLLINTRIDAGPTNKTFANPSWPLGYDRYKPSIRAKWLFDKIMDNIGYTYSSDFFSSDTFNKLYISAFGNEANYKLDDVVNSNTGIAVAYYNWDVPTYDNTWYRWVSQNVVGAGQDLFTTGPDYLETYYTCPLNGTYTFRYGFDYRYIFVFDEDVEIQTRLVRQTPGGATSVFNTQTITITPANYGITGNFETEFQISGLQAGDKIIPQIRVNMSPSNAVYGGSGIKTGSFFQVYRAPGSMAPTSHLNCETQQIDFIKFLFTKFRLVIVPDKTKENHFIIEPWVNYIGSGEVRDWSGLLDNSKDIVIEPLFYTQKKSITFSDKEGTDYLSDDYQITNDRPYGQLIVEDNNQLLKDDREIKTEFVMPINQNLESANQQTTRGMDNVLIPQVHSHETKDSGGVFHRPIKSQSYAFFYNGMLDTGTFPSVNLDYYIRDEGLNDYTWNKYPRVSIFSDDALNSFSTHLTWRKEPELQRIDVYDVEPGKSAYDGYWKDYLDLLYDTFSRRITAYFNLNDTEIRNFKFSDVVFLNGTYYYVEKIYDYSPLNQTTTKVDLIKLKNYRPIITPIEPGIIWDNQTDLWNTTTTTWDD